MLTIALSKGRIFDETLPLLAAANIIPAEDPESSRKLILATNHPDVRLVIVRATDVPTYVQHGAADLGIAGRDVLIEHGGAGLYQPLDLNIACCKMMVAAPNGFDYAAAADHDPLAPGFRQQRIGLHLDQERQRAGRRGDTCRCPECRAGGEELSSVEGHVSVSIR